MLKDLNNEGKRDGMKLSKEENQDHAYWGAESRLGTELMIDGEQFEEVTE